MKLCRKLDKLPKSKNFKMKAVKLRKVHGFFVFGDKNEIRKLSQGN